MEIINSPYISEKIKHPKRILRKLRRNKLVPGVFLIRLAYEPDQLEIIRADLFKQTMLNDEKLMIVGICKDYSDACDMIVRMTDDAIATFGTPNLRKLVLR